MSPAEQDALGEIRRIFAVELGVARTVDPELDLRADLQLDSLGLLTLVVGLEDRFRVALREEDADGVRTVCDLARLVAVRISEAGRGS